MRTITEKKSFEWEQVRSAAATNAISYGTQATKQFNAVQVSIVIVDKSV